MPPDSSVEALAEVDSTRTRVWFAAIGLALGVLGIGLFLPREWRDGHHSDLGSMSRQWRAEHRAGSR